MAPPTSSASSHLPSASSNSLPGLLLCYEGLAELLAFKGDISAAKSVYESGFKSFRTLKLTPRFLRQYASFEKRSGSLQAASDLYRLAAQIEPCDPKTWLQWGVVERRRKRYEMAEECFRRGVAAAPTHPHLWYAYGTMQWKLGNIEGARATFSQATGLCPRSPPLWMEWAIMEWTSSQGKGAGEARRLFQHGSDPSKITTPYQHPPLFQAWADMERADGNEDKANKLLEQATLFSIRKSSKEERPR
jgi:tetratricopeptide (TPR) repeat protein